MTSRKKTPGECPEEKSDMPVRKVAIGVPVFNGERWLENTIQSILNQDFPDFELVIGDNASTDNTPNICAEYQKLDNRVRYFRNPHNLGVYRNYDLVFERSYSRYFKWCAVGDSCDPSFIAKAVRVLDTDCKVVLASAKTRLKGQDIENVEKFLADLHIMDDQPAQRYRYFLDHVRLNNVMNGLIRRNALTRTALNKPFRASDVCLMAELSLIGKFYEIPEELLCRRMEVDTATVLRKVNERHGFYVGDAAKANQLVEWKRNIALLTGIIRSKVNLHSKLSLLLYLGRRMSWGRTKLIRELIHMVRRRHKHDLRS
jgi:glycosyltransferase involved in cell wall biosynthesis